MFKLNLIQAEQELIHLFIWQKHWTQQLIIWSWAEVVWLLMKSKRYSATNSKIILKDSILEEVQMSRKNLL